jgi:glycosyltransferase involved in cell wall biosynthesis
MSTLINLYNQTGAGPKNISLNLISELSRLKDGRDTYFIIVPNFAEYATLISTQNVRLFKLSKFNSFFTKGLFRVYLELVFIPWLVSRHKIKNILAFGNFLLALVKVPKYVLMHHPYLFDDTLLSELPILSRLSERAKRLVFELTLRNVDVVIVQSPYVREQFQKKWSSYKGNLSIIENPISRSFPQHSVKEVEELISNRVKTLKVEVCLLYVSRFYPHKNHDFLIDLSKRLVAAEIPHKILITIDQKISGANKLLEKISDENLPIFNLGEISQHELDNYYKSSHLFLFPSKSETFGNPLIEAMSYSLPIIVPTLGYAHAAVSNAGIYYQENNVEDCVRKIKALVEDKDSYSSSSLDSYARFGLFPNSKEWLKKYLELLSLFTPVSKNIGIF